MFLDALTINALYSMSPGAPFQYMLFYFLRIVRHFLIKFCIDVCSTTLMVTALKPFIHIIYFWVGSHFSVFLEQLFQFMFLFFLRTLQYFLMIFCADGFSVTLMAIALKKGFYFKWCKIFRHRHDAFQNLIRFCQAVIIYKI